MKILLVGKKYLDKIVKICLTTKQKRGKITTMDTTKLIQYYEERFDLLAHPGWKTLLEDAQEYRDAVADITTVETIEELHQRKGQLKALDWLLTMKEVWEKAYEELVNEDTE